MIRADPMVLLNAKVQHRTSTMPSSEMDAYAKLKVGDCQQEVSRLMSFNGACAILVASLLASKWFSSAGMLFIALEQLHLCTSHAPEILSSVTGPRHRTALVHCMALVSHSLRANTRI